MLLAPVLAASGSEPLSISVSPTSVLKLTSSSSGTTSVVTLTITGGVAPYTAVWESSNSPTIVASSPTSTTSSAFDWTGLVGVEAEADATITITVTDSATSSATFYCNVSIIKFS